MGGVMVHPFGQRGASGWQPRMVSVELLAEQVLVQALRLLRRPWPHAVEEARTQGSMARRLWVGQSSSD